MRNKPRLLLHCCCAPCSSSVLEQLADEYDITLYFYNPNVFPDTEYYKRAKELEKLVNITGKYKIIYEKYNHDEFLKNVAGLEQEKEGGLRCHSCYELRLRKAAEAAKKGNFDFFTTTLSVSPYKNADILNEIGNRIELEIGNRQTRYFPANFKRNDGFLRVSQLSKKYGLYRQNYCGCEFSIR